MTFKYLYVTFPDLESGGAEDCQSIDALNFDRLKRLRFVQKFLIISCLICWKFRCLALVGFHSFRLLTIVLIEGSCNKFLFCKEGKDWPVVIAVQLQVPSLRVMFNSNNLCRRVMFNSNNLCWQVMFNLNSLWWRVMFNLNNLCWEVMFNSNNLCRRVMFNSNNLCRRVMFNSVCDGELCST